MNHEKLLGLLLNASFEIKFNMNDTFYWASADRSIVMSEHLKKMLPILDKYGYYTIIAYEALKRGHDPEDDVEVKCAEYFEAKKEVALLNFEFEDIE